MASSDEQLSRQAYIELFLPQRAADSARQRLSLALDEIGVLEGLSLVWFCVLRLLSRPIRLRALDQASKTPCVESLKRYNLACSPVFDESRLWFGLFGPPSKEPASSLAVVGLNEIDDTSDACQPHP